MGREVEPLCPHPRKGRVTNQAWGYDEKRPFMCVPVCERLVCQRVARVKVQANTGEEAVFVEDE